MKDILSRKDSKTVIVPEPIEEMVVSNDQKEICSFCNRSIVFAWQLSDGRRMCAHCHDHQKTQKMKLKIIY
ncbi:hypothetical protein P261_00116 [Lachnospiraceae bacterium TWA4]|nr:hypothetical protein P261_00116 [Lachnospiraceae bacterium TWA4]